jgi:predicted PurR-regulated permease PerM
VTTTTPTPTPSPLPAPVAPPPPQGSRLFYIAIVVASLFLLGQMLLPFASALFLAAVLAGSLLGLHDRLSGRLGNRPGLAAGLLTLLLVVAIAGPLASLTAVSISEASQGFAYLSQALTAEGLHGLAHRLPETMHAWADRMVDSVPDPKELFDTLSESGKSAAAAFGGVLTATGRLLFLMLLTLVGFFFFLTSGRQLVSWLESVVPLKPGEFRTLMAEFRKVTRAVLISTVATAAVQSIAALVGFLIARVPNALFFGMVTFVAALIPIGAAGMVSIILAITLLLGGRTGAGIFLLIWGALVVGTIDNIAKPFFIRGGVELHGAVVFFALLGGLAAFGPVGIIAGPLVVAFFVAVTRLERPQRWDTR